MTVTSVMEFLKVLMSTFRVTAFFSSMLGSSGKSSAAIPLMVDLYLLAVIMSLLSFARRLMLVPFGRLVMNSARSLAGTVMVPGFLTWAARKSTVASSRLVAVRESWLPSARRRTLLRMGRPARVVAATRLTILRAFANLS